MLQPGLLQLFPEPTGSILSPSQRTELQRQAALLSSIPRPDPEQTHVRAPMKVSVRVLFAEGCPDQSCGCLFWSRSALRVRSPPVRKRHLWPTLGEGELLVELGTQRDLSFPTEGQSTLQETQSRWSRAAPHSSSTKPQRCDQ